MSNLGDAAKEAMLDLARGKEVAGAFGLPAAPSEEISVSVVVSVVLGFVLFAIGWMVEPLGASWWATRRRESPQEQSFPVGASSTVVSNKFPSLLSDAPAVDLSVVVVVHNDEARLSVLLDEARTFLQARADTRRSSVTNHGPNGGHQYYRFEIIVVDMCSSDNSRQAAFRFTEKYSSDVVRLLQLDGFQGRGTAIRKGIMRAQGKHILVLDSDCEIPFQDLSRLEAGMEQIENKFGHGVVIGSLAHYQVPDPMQPLDSEESTLQYVLMRSFRVLFQLLCVRDIYDTQCAFKLFSRNAARRIFSSQHVQSLGVDCEVLFLAHRMHIPVKEQAVSSNVINPGLSIVCVMQLLRDLVVMRTAYMLGLWAIPN